MKQRIYRSIFWIGYVIVFVAAFISLKKDLHNKTIDFVSIKIHFDQVLHTIVYFMIIMYFYAGKHFRLTLFDNNSFKKFLLLIIILATVTEVVQLAVPYRSFNFIDILANIFGIGIGVVIGRSVGLKAAGGRQ